MNEQIVKLSREAENYACTVAEKYVPECGEVSYLWEHSFREKFAELLVQACADVANAGLDLDEDYLIGDSILKHFGVEQE
jgi:hypothetical protein